MQDVQWKRLPGGVLKSADGVWSIYATADTSSGKPCQWGVSVHDDVITTTNTRGKSNPRVFDSLRAAKSYVVYKLYPGEMDARDKAARLRRLEQTSAEEKYQQALRKFEMARTQLVAAATDYACSRRAYLSDALSNGSKLNIAEDRLLVRAVKVEAAGQKLAEAAKKVKLLIK